MLSRQSNRGRMAYDRVTSEVSRECIFVGTTNDAEYLKDHTGNLRFWPTKVNNLDIEALRRDVDQLWAEANVWEAQGCSVCLSPKL